MSSSTFTSEGAELRRFLTKLFTFTLILALLYAVLSVVSNSGRFDGTYITAQSYKLNQMRGPTDYDVVIMGDSCAMAINPNNASTQRMLPGRTVYNFALVNLGGLYPLYSTLEKYLANGKRPKVIVLSFLPSMLTDSSDILGSSRFTKFYAAKFYTYSELLSDPMLRSHPRAFFSLLVEKSKAHLDYSAYDIPYNEGMIKRVKEQSGQLLILDSTSATPEQVLSAPQYRADFRFSRRSANYLSMFLKLAREHNIQVIMFVMPEPDNAYQKRIDSGYFAKYFEALHELELQHDNFTVLKNVISYPPALFARDVTHLNRTGVERFHDEYWPAVLSKVNELLVARDGVKPPKEPNPNFATTVESSLRHGAEFVPH